MKAFGTLIVMACLATSAPFSVAQDAKPEEPRPQRIAPAEAKDHIGQSVVTCGKVVETKVDKYGIPDHGKPIYFYLDQPQATQVFYFVTFGTKEGGPTEAINAYKDKNVCVTGKITLASGRPYIMVADRTTIKIQTEEKKEAK
jgi:hypothetical protein